MKNKKFISLAIAVSTATTVIPAAIFAPAAGAQESTTDSTVATEEAVEAEEADTTEPATEESDTPEPAAEAPESDSVIDESEVSAEPVAEEAEPAPEPEVEVASLAEDEGDISGLARAYDPTGKTVDVPRPPMHTEKTVNDPFGTEDNAEWNLDGVREYYPENNFTWGVDKQGNLTATPAKGFSWSSEGPDGARIVVGKPHDTNRDKSVDPEGPISKLGARYLRMSEDGNGRVWNIQKINEDFAGGENVVFSTNEQRELLATPLPGYFWSDNGTNDLRKIRERPAVGPVVSRISEEDKLRILETPGAITNGRWNLDIISGIFLEESGGGYDLVVNDKGQLVAKLREDVSWIDTLTHEDRVIFDRELPPTGTTFSLDELTRYGVGEYARNYFTQSPGSKFPSLDETGIRKDFNQGDNFVFYWTTETEIIGDINDNGLVNTRLFANLDPESGYTWSDGSAGKREIANLGDTITPAVQTAFAPDNAPEPTPQTILNPPGPNNARWNIEWLRDNYPTPAGVSFELGKSGELLAVIDRPGWTWNTDEVRGKGTKPIVMAPAPKDMDREVRTPPATIDVTDMALMKVDKKTGKTEWDLDKVNAVHKSEGFTWEVRGRKLMAVITEPGNTWAGYANSRSNAVYGLPGPAAPEQIPGKTITNPRGSDNAAWDLEALKKFSPERGFKWAVDEDGSLWYIPGKDMKINDKEGIPMERVRVADKPADKDRNITAPTGIEPTDLNTDTNRGTGDRVWNLDKVNATTKHEGYNWSVDPAGQLVATLDSTRDTWGDGSVEPKVFPKPSVGKVTLGKVLSTTVKDGDTTGFDVLSSQMDEKKMLAIGAAVIGLGAVMATVSKNVPEGTPVDKDGNATTGGTVTTVEKDKISESPAINEPGATSERPTLNAHQRQELLKALNNSDDNGGTATTAVADTTEAPATTDPVLPEGELAETGVAHMGIAFGGGLVALALGLALTAAAGADRRRKVNV